MCVCVCVCVRERGAGSHQSRGQGWNFQSPVASVVGSMPRPLSISISIYLSTNSCIQVTRDACETTYSWGQAVWSPNIGGTTHLEHDPKGPWPFR